MPPPPPVNPRQLSPAESREGALRLFQGLGADLPLPDSAERPDAYDALVRAILSSAAVSSSRVSCTLTVSPAAVNPYNTLHGGVVAAVAEAVGMACARAAAGDKEMFLGELSTAYLAAARLNQSKQPQAGEEMAEGEPRQKLSPADSRVMALGFIRHLGSGARLPASAELPDAYSALVRAILSSTAVCASPDPRVSCTITVSPAVANSYNTLHGGAVAAVAEAVGLACARAAAGDKEMFLGELSTAYLAAARVDSEVDVEAQILRKGRSVVVTTIEFRLKDTKKLCYTSRATFYIMPVASL